VSAFWVPLIWASNTKCSRYAVWLLAVVVMVVTVTVVMVGMVATVVMVATVARLHFQCGY
jgi:hypothetical protein